VCARKTVIAINSDENNSTAARKKGAPGKWSADFAAMANVKTWVKRGGPAMPVMERKELMAP
jgi:hypothetical protein